MIYWSWVWVIKKALSGWDFLKSSKKAVFWQGRASLISKM